jgi:NitT/TauT family transport system substrate-binding protein
MPSVSGAEAAVKSAAGEMKKAGMLLSSTDVQSLAQQAFVHLDGVSDEWIQKLEVEKIAGDVPSQKDIRRFANIILGDSKDRCCIISVK